MGIESGRLHFSWISSAEAGKFVDVVKELTDEIRELGPATRLIKELLVLDDYSVGSWQLTEGSGQNQHSAKSMAHSKIQMNNE